MKVIKNNGSSKEIGIDFEGLCVDKDGALWLFGRDGACLLYEDDSAVFYDSKELERAFENCSPFTKFTGSVTISN